MSNTVHIKQNEPKYQQYLMAQRQLYTDCKKWQKIWFTCAVVIAVISSGIMSFSDIVSIYLSVFYLILAAIEWIINKSVIQGIKKRAAKIQELFDCELFELPWNNTDGSKPDEKTIQKAADKFKAKTSIEDQEKLRNWYKSDYKDLPLYKARIFFQSDSLQWDFNLRYEYAGHLLMIVFLVLMGLIVLGIIFDWSFRQFAHELLFVLIPIAFFVWDLIHGHITAASAQRKAKFKIDALIKLINEEVPSDQNLSEEKLTIISKDFQNCIYKLRSESPSVGDEFYEKKRKEYQELEQYKFQV